MRSGRINEERWQNLYLAFSKQAAIKFYRNTLLSFIVISQKFELKLINAKFFLPMISRNELSITLSTL